MNVLVYSGEGSTTEGVRHTLASLRQLLSPYYAVITISEAALLHDPWMSKTAMLVVPGGADLPYCRALNGHGNRRIQQYVRGGGKFLGICAGGYYGSARCEFEVGDSAMEVSGPRELAFFPGTCAGAAYKGFVYDSHEGARAAFLTVNEAALEAHGAPKSVTTYYNGGGMFMNASQYPGVEVLARYDEVTDVHDDAGDLAAVIHCKVGKGNVVLSGVHPEYMSSLVKPTHDDLHFNMIAADLQVAEDSRKRFLGACLSKAGLKINHDPKSSLPSLKPIYMLSYFDQWRIRQLVADLHENMDFVAPNTFEDNTDTIVLHDETEDEQRFMGGDDGDGDDSTTERSLDDLAASEKHIKVFTSGALPDVTKTPFFDTKLYFTTLKQLYDDNGVISTNRAFGSLLLYGEVVMSTNTLLDSNPNWLKYLPTGLTFAATTQLAGRGRGSNVWVSPKGVMATSVVYRVSPDASANSYIITLQYLCALAVIESILGYGSTRSGKGVGYEDMPLRLKWPNDMLALKPEYFTTLSDKDDISSTVEGDDQKWAKISGGLVNSQFLNGQFYLVWGGGLNLSNEAPTTSLNSVLQKLNQIRASKGLSPLAPFKHETLLAKIIFNMGQFHNVFQTCGLQPFLSLYYKRWLHSDQEIKLDAEGNGTTRSCVIKGITSEDGLLMVKDLSTGEMLQLQPDGNSFNFFEGLMYKKR
ncbi:hypothetical protein JCM33374_g4815 [Metschnikowia sp. JCM 33374]|nr:hypothetical protein JCM33374_g4815 [Metschnikowia sp. JCM 33374]